MPKFIPKHILIAPLDWGLGHTARCIPIIHHIKALGHMPIVAGNASQQQFIKDTFGAIDIIDLEGYNITYSKWNRFAQAGLLLQLPAIQKTINKEHQWLQQLSERIQIDGVISDNRYGLFHPSIPCAIMTHQLMVQSGMGNTIDRTMQKIHNKYLQQFNHTWVVDIPGNPNLAGNLAHPQITPPKTICIGLLSRFADREKVNAQEDHLLLLLSGAEPARTILSELLWQQAISHKGKIIFVEGNETAATPTNIPPHITHYKRLTGAQLSPLLASASMVICRSGYSTIMDLIALRKKAILIPTPGQTEQEYLARHLQQQGIFYAQKQQGFHLQNALASSGQFPYKFPLFLEAFSLHKEVISQWLDSL